MPVIAVLVLLLAALVPAAAQTPLWVTQAPSSSPSAGIASIVSASLEGSHVLKTTGGNLYSVYVVNLTGGTSGFLEVFDAKTAPADGAVTPKDCLAVAAGGNNSLANISLPPSVYATGIVAVISSGSTCFTKTTGVLTAFINAKVQ